MNTYVTIHHGKAIFNVLPANAQRVHDTLALIDKSKGLKGRKVKTSAGGKFSSMKRDYPVFEPGMTTSDYVLAYQRLNDRLKLCGGDYCHIERPAPMLDPSYPEVMEEI